MIKLLLRFFIVYAIVSVIIDGTTISNEGQLNIEEDNPHAYEQVEIHFVKYLREKLVEFYTTISSYGNNVATAKGIHKVASEFEIIVFGPARVGKSTLIQQISGDLTIKTSASIDACTVNTQDYIDDYGIRWWDTPGKFCIIN